MEQEGFDLSELGTWEFGDEPGKQTQKSQSASSRTSNVVRRGKSEAALREHLDWHWTTGKSYHVISQGDIDSLTFLRIAIEQRPLDYCLISTWCMSPEDAMEIKSWVDKKLIKRIDFYVGEIFQKGYRGAYDILCEIANGCGGRVCVFRNHSKVMIGASGDWKFAIASSANVNTNPRCENTTITMDANVYNFYKEFYDNIIAFNRNFDGWNPQQEDGGNHEA